VFIPHYACGIAFAGMERTLRVFYRWRDVLGLELGDLGIRCSPDEPSCGFLYGIVTA